MHRPAIEIEALRKEYRRRRSRTVALSGLDLTVPSGGVYGLLGPNGSGKTTAIRCLLGLVGSTAGSVQLLGRPVPNGLSEAMSEVGAIVEEPALFPTMTGRENLSLLARIGRLGSTRVDAALEEVGLAERADSAVRTYSLGMRQRLGLAAALLKDPELLILDEPANGLDPSGMRQVRDLLRRLGAEGRTVLVSSHLLSEVEQTCDRVAILHRGRCIREGTVASVLGADPGLIVRVGDLDAAQAVLAARGIAVERCDGHLRVACPPSAADLVSRVLGEHGQWVSELRPQKRSLEELFLELTADADTDVDTAEVEPTRSNQPMEVHP